MTPPNLTLIAAALCLATAARTETCVFTTECFENETCTETHFEMTVEVGALVTQAETIPVTSGGSETTGVFVGSTASAFHVLTRMKNSQARYTTHIFDGPLMVNYLGTCTQ